MTVKAQRNDSTNNNKNNNNEKPNPDAKQLSTVSFSADRLHELSRGNCGRRPRPLLFHEQPRFDVCLCLHRTTFQQIRVPWPCTSVDANSKININSNAKRTFEFFSALCRVDKNFQQGGNYDYDFYYYATGQG